MKWRKAGQGVSLTHDPKHSVANAAVAMARRQDVKLPSRCTAMTRCAVRAPSGDNARASKQDFFESPDVDRDLDQEKWRRNPESSVVIEVTTRVQGCKTPRATQPFGLLV